MRQKLVVGNWKMHGDRAMTTTWCAAIARGLAQENEHATRAATDSTDETAVGVEVALCPPHILIPLAVTALAGSRVAVGAQDVDANDNGPFSGQVSARMLVDSGCRYVIVGHSERRTHYGETDELVAQKTKAALEVGLSVIVCLGETLAQRQSGNTEHIVGQQLDAVLNEVGAAAFANNVIAYEPVWAIGSGLTATPAQAQQVHRFIRKRLATHNPHAAATCRILYGGSMKPQNAAQLLAKADIDGGLIGGAALQATDFLAICNAT